MTPAEINRNLEILEQLQVILERENPCNVQVDAAGVASCREGRPCCHNCPQLTATGCKSVPPACKFFFCHAAWEHLPEPVREEINSLGQAFVGPLRLRGYKQTMQTRPPYIW